MVLNLVIARKGTGSVSIKCEPITKVIECQDNATNVEIEDIQESAIFELAAEHGIDLPLWGSTTANTMEKLVDGFIKYFDAYEKRRCAEAS